ncbi:hypothetical protein COC63_06925 [Bacillus cereus]|nr:hypothetical protein COC63_06925 [Bacillus cereus]
MEDTIVAIPLFSNVPFYVLGALLFVLFVICVSSLCVTYLIFKERRKTRAEVRDVISVVDEQTGHDFYRKVSEEMETLIPTLQYAKTEYWRVDKYDIRMRISGEFSAFLHPTAEFTWIGTEEWKTPLDGDFYTADLDIVQNGKFLRTEKQVVRVLGVKGLEHARLVVQDLQDVQLPSYIRKKVNPVLELPAD